MNRITFYKTRVKLKIHMAYVHLIQLLYIMQLRVASVETDADTIEAEDVNWHCVIRIWKTISARKTNEMKKRRDETLEEFKEKVLPLSLW